MSSHEDLSAIQPQHVYDRVEPGGSAYVPTHFFGVTSVNVENLSDTAWGRASFRNTVTGEVWDSDPIAPRTT